MTIPARKWNLATALTAVVLIAAAPTIGMAAQQPKATTDTAQSDTAAAKVDKAMFVSTAAYCGLPICRRWICRRRPAARSRPCPGRG